MKKSEGKCYDIQIKDYQLGLFDDSVDCTYVILCCGSHPEREQACVSQLNRLRPTKQVKLVYNQGFRTCHKELEKQSTEYDLRDALMFVFNDAQDCNRILVLEDDFEIDERVLNKTNVGRINDFLKVTNPDVYGLGNVSLLCPFDFFRWHQRSLFMFMSHAIVYGLSYRQQKLLFYRQRASSLPRHVDLMWNVSRHNVYRYYKPLIYQKHDVTENMRNWPIPMWISLVYVTVFNLRKNARQGYDNLNFLSYAMTLLISLGFLSCVVMVCKKIIFRR